MGDAQVSVVPGYDLRGLAAEPDATELRRFRRGMERTTGLPARAAWRRLVADTVLRGAICLVIVVPAVLLAVAVCGLDAAPDSTAVVVAILTIIAAGACWFVLRPVPRRWRALRPWRRWLRLSRFAEDNGLHFAPESDPSRAGLMFRQGAHPRLRDVVTSADGSFEIGTFTFVSVDAIASTRDPAYGFVRIRLPRPVPHLVLVSMARRDAHGLSSVGLGFAESQRVRLEGDFDRSFAVYAPDGYGVDARYVLTPDFMARLVDHAAAFDLEFVDDDLFVYSRAGFDVEMPQTWAWLRWFTELVGSAAVRRTERFRDERSIAPGVVVAPQGRRLRVGAPAAAAAIIVALTAIQVIRLVVTNSP